MTYYEVLEVHEGAGFTEIKSSYRRLVKIYHPDLNSSAMAKERIVLITEAYEYLSDPVKRSQYDARFYVANDTTSYRQPTAPQYRDEREIRRQEYIKKKRMQEQHQWDQLFKIKVKFYKAQRYFAFVFLLVGLVYTWDYYFLEEQVGFKVMDIGLNNRGSCGVSLFGIENFMAEEEFFYQMQGNLNREVNVYFSRLHLVPVAVGTENMGIYKISETVHSFNNFFGFLLTFLGVLLIVNHKYAEWRLTLGLLPFFITIFLLLLTLTTRSGIY
jgi:hypothetical protein